MAIPVQYPKKDDSGPQNLWLYTSLAAPASNVVLLDSGPLIAGAYEVITTLGSDAIANTSVYIEHRDAANLVTLGFVSLTNRTRSNQVKIKKVSLVVNERFRVRTIGASIATVYVSMMYRQVG